MIFSYPGDVDAPDYLKLCPDPMPVQISLTGTTGQPTIPNNITEFCLRSVEVKTFVYDPVKKSLPFTVSVFFPNTARWENTRPPRGRLVSIVGEIVGKKEDGGQIAVLVQSFDYIFAQSPEMATEAGVNHDPQSSPQTPQKSRWKNWHSRSAATRNSPTTPGKKRAADAVDSDGDSQYTTPPSKNQKLPSSPSETVDGSSS
jgi:hypothetical protein